MLEYKCAPYAVQLLHVIWFSNFGALNVGLRRSLINCFNIKTDVLE